MAGPLTERPGPEASAEEQDRWWVDVAFTGALQQRSWAWPALLVAILGAHLAGALWQMDRGRPVLWALVGNRGVRPLERMGGLTGTALEDGEPWRLVTSLFLHGDGLHLALNAAALVGLGTLCEALFGPERLLWLFLWCGVAGGLLSWSGDLTVSVGASGALFGWMGAVLGFGWRWRRVLPEDLSGVLWRRLLPWVVLNLGIGLLIPFLDHRAHLGGLIMGVAMGALGGNRVVPGREIGALGRAAILVICMGVLACGLWGLLVSGSR